MSAAKSVTAYLVDPAACPQCHHVVFEQVVLIQDRLWSDVWYVDLMTDGRLNTDWMVRLPNGEVVNGETARDHGFSYNRARTIATLVRKDRKIPRNVPVPHLREVIA